MKCALVVRFVKSRPYHSWLRHTRKNLSYYAYRKIRRKYKLIFIKTLEYLSFSTVHCCTVFEENCNLLSIQSGGPKFTKFAYVCQISQFCSDLKKKTTTCHQIDRLIPKIYIFLCLSVPFRFKKSSSGGNQNVNISRSNGPITIKFNI